MNTSKLAFSDAFGLHTTSQIKRADPTLSTKEAKGIAYGHNFRKILSYIPLVNTITGIITAFILMCRKPGAFRNGLLLRSLTLDLFSIIPLTFAIDAIVTLARFTAKNSTSRGRA